MNLTLQSVYQRKRRKKIRLDESQPNDAEETVTHRKKFRLKSFIPIIDALQTKLKKRALLTIRSQIIIHSPLISMPQDCKLTGT